MGPTRRVLMAIGLFVLVGATSIAAAPTVAKPVIGKPLSLPAQAVAGKPFAVAFKVTRSDSGAPLLKGTMMCDPSVAGKLIRHTESFKAGTARTSFVVPTSAQGKVLKVKLTITSAGRSATRVAAFPVRALAKPSLSIGDVASAEGNAATTMSFTVNLSPVSTQTVTVNYATVNGTATGRPTTWRQAAR